MREITLMRRGTEGIDSDAVRLKKAMKRRRERLQTIARQFARKQRRQGNIILLHDPLADKRSLETALERRVKRWKKAQIEKKLEMERSIRGF